MICQMVGYLAFAADLKQCDGQWFNNDDKQCCHGTINNRPSASGCSDRANDKCCEQEAFDNGSRMCCHGEINDRPDDCPKANHKCCDTVAFCNVDLKCDGGIVPK